MVHKQPNLSRKRKKRRQRFSLQNQPWTKSRLSPTYYTISSLRNPRRQTLNPCRQQQTKKLTIWMFVPSTNAIEYCLNPEPMKTFASNVKLINALTSCMKTLPITAWATSVADYTKAIWNKRGSWSVTAKKQFPAEWAKQKEIQVAPTLYVETGTVDSFSGQMWYYSRKIRKNKPNDSIEQSPRPGVLEGGWPITWARGVHWFPWRQPHMDPTPQRRLETSKSMPCFPSQGVVTERRLTQVIEKSTRC